MEISVEKQGPCLRKVKVVVAPEQIKEELADKYEETRQNMSLPGFRKGKVPKKLIEKKFGAAILLEIKESLIQESFSKAIKDHELDIIDDPKMDIESIELNENEPLEFEIEVEVRPEFELNEFKKLEIEVPPIEISVEEIDKSIDGIRNRSASLETIEDDGIKKGDYVTAKVTYAIEGEDDLVREETQVNTLNNVVDALEVDAGTIDLFLDKKAGQEIAFDAPELPKTFMPENLRGRAAKVSVTISEIKRITPPELDESFFKQIGVKSLDELNEKVREGLSLQKTDMRQQLVDEKIVDKLLELHTFELPEELLRKQAERQEFTRQAEMQRMGFPSEAVEEKTQELKESNLKSAERFLRYSFIFDKIGNKEKVFVTESDMEAEFKRIATAQGTTPQAIRENFEERDMVSSLRARIREDIIRKVLRDSAVVIEKKTDEPASQAQASEETAEKDASASSE